MLRIIFAILKNDTLYCDKVVAYEGLSVQAGLDTKAERQAAPLGHPDDHQPSSTNGRYDRSGTNI